VACFQTPRLNAAAELGRSARSNWRSSPVGVPACWLLTGLLLPCRSAWARANLLQPSQGTQLGTSHPSGDRLRHRDLAPAEIPVGIRTPYFQPACCQSDAHTYLRFLWVSFVLGAKPRPDHC